MRSQPCPRMGPRGGGNVPGRRLNLGERPIANTRPKSSLSSATSRPHIYGSSGWILDVNGRMTHCPAGRSFARCARRASRKRRPLTPICKDSAYPISYCRTTPHSRLISTGSTPHVCHYKCGMAFKDPARRHRHMVEEHGYIPRQSKKKHKIGQPAQDTLDLESGKARNPEGGEL